MLHFYLFHSLISGMLILICFTACMDNGASCFWICFMCSRYSILPGTLSPVFNTFKLPSHILLQKMRSWYYHVIYPNSYIALFCLRFLVENVASMTWMDRDEISKYLKLQPIELDSIELAPSKRRRLYWTNIPHPARLPRVKNHPSTFVQSCLLDGIALEEKTGVLTLALFLFFPCSKTKLSTLSSFLSLSLTLLPLLQSFVFVSVGNLPSMP
jgi:DNA (cytosine-5)-methyltransferase 3A